MIVIGRKSRVTLFASVWMAFALPADANDIFIGTLSIEGERVVLRRCALAQNAYVLRDAEGVSAVAAMRKREPAAKGYWYGEVIGKYIEIEGVDGLSVASVENIEADRSCHLLDLIDDESLVPQVDSDAAPKDSARSHRDD